MPFLLTQTHSADLTVGHSFILIVTESSQINAGQLVAVTSFSSTRHTVNVKLKDNVKR